MTYSLELNYSILEKGNFREWRKKSNEKKGTNNNCKNYNMPGGAIQTDMLSGIEEESDIYEGFSPHVDFANIPLSNESSPGKWCPCRKSMWSCSEYN